MRLARQAGEAGGVVPALFNAANEEAVAAFRRVGCRSRHFAPRRAYLDERRPRRTRARGRRPGRGEVGPGARPRHHRRGRPPRRSLRREAVWHHLTVLGIVPSPSACCSRSAGTSSATSLGSPSFGMRVTQFMVGFGTTVWSRQRGETEYGFKAIPLGGYIRMVGMVPPAEEGESKRATRMRSFIAEVRGAGAQRRPAHRRRPAVLRQPWWQRVVVMSAGPVPQPDPGRRLLRRHPGRHRRRRLTTTTVGARLRPSRRGRERPADLRGPGHRRGSVRRRAGLRGARESPAAIAGLRPGDTIVAFDGKPVTSCGTAGRVRTPIRGSPGTPARADHRAGRPAADGARSPRSRNTVYVDGRQRPDRSRAGFLGLEPDAGVRPPAGQRLPGYFGGFIGAVARQARPDPAADPAAVPARPSSAPSATRTARSASSASAGSAARSSPSTSHHGLEAASSSACWPASTWCCSCSTCCRSTRWTAGTSPARCTSGCARAVPGVRGRPDPGPFDIARLMPVAYVVAGLFLVLSGLLVVADIVNPVKL